MAKITKYFETQAELLEYYPNGVPSNVLAIVGTEGVLYASSNNYVEHDVPVDQGGYNISPEDEEKLNDAYEFATTYGASKDYVAEYVSTHAPEPDLTGYATESYVVSKIEDVVGAAPAALDTLKEIGDSLNNDADFAGTMTAALAAKANANDVYTKVQTDEVVEDAVSIRADRYNMGAQYVENMNLSEVMNATGLITEQNLIGEEPFYTLNPILSNNSNNIVIKGEKKWVPDPVMGGGSYVQTTYYPTQTFTEAGIVEYHYEYDLIEGDKSYYTINPMATQSYVADYVSTYGGGSQVQANWNESDSTASSYILNKPELNFLPLNGGGNVTGNILMANQLQFAKNSATDFTMYATTTGTQLNGFTNTIFTNGGTSNISAVITSGRKMYIYGVGNYTGGLWNNAHDLAYVINDIQTTLGSAASVAEIIVGNN